MIQRIYVFFAALLVRALVKYCTARGRYVDYVHSEPPQYTGTVRIGEDGLMRAVNDFVKTVAGGERVYMRRYVITGFMTGDAHPNTLLSFTHGPGLWGYVRRIWNEARRWWALNRWHLYLHHMHAPDADPCLHDHPWPWGLSWVLLGGYREQRLDPLQLKRARFGVAGGLNVSRFELEPRWLHAPALNVLRGTTFHRISELKMECYPCALNTCDMFGKVAREGHGVFTLFLAGPRRASKPWGYLVPGRGFVPQRERHAEMGASERRAGST